jgi:hypothetical protein
MDTEGDEDTQEENTWPDLLAQATTLGAVRCRVLAACVEEVTDLALVAARFQSLGLARQCLAQSKHLLRAKAFPEPVRLKLELKEASGRAALHLQTLRQLTLAAAPPAKVAAAIRKCLQSIAEQQGQLSACPAPLKRSYDMQEAEALMAILKAMARCPLSSLPADKIEAVVASAEAAGVHGLAMGNHAGVLAAQALRLARNACDTTHDERNASALPVGWARVPSKSTPGTFAYVCHATGKRQRSPDAAPPPVPGVTWTSPFAIELTEEEATHRVALAAFCADAIQGRIPCPSETLAGIKHVMIESIFASCR